MLERGDFSGQFVAFSAYQYERIVNGEVPLWNPYNNAGLPFIADTQAAVFYPPRLVNIAISSLTGGWRYASLQFEMIAHVFILTVGMYAFVRRVSMGQRGSVTASFISAVIAGYGGFVSGYPPLQLALLEAAVWFPVALLGVLEATRKQKLDWFWLLLTGFALGLTWMAGHPQTALYSTYLVMAYMAYRVYIHGLGWSSFLLGTAFFGVITFGLVAVQFIPGVEYTFLSIRTDLSFEEKGNGFPVHDVVQFLFPGVVSLWSPLFVGVTGLVLSMVALTRRTPDVLFWVGAAAVALALSFGANGALYHLAYNVVPGLQFFRGQERAAFIVAMSLAILAGHGVLVLANVDVKNLDRLRRWIEVGLTVLLVICVLFTLGLMLLWLGDSETYQGVTGSVVFSTLVIGLLFAITHSFLREGRSLTLLSALGILVVIELFTVNIDNSNFEPYDPDVLVPPSYIRDIIADEESEPFRIDGNLYALDGNFATLYRVMDIRGTSPLFVDGPHAIIERVLPSEVAWELFAVRYVLTGAPELPLPAELIRTELYEDKTIYFHRLSDPRPYALLRYDFEVLDSDDFARALLADPSFNERDVVILSRNPGLLMPSEIPENDSAVVQIYTPERIRIEISAPENAVLSLSHVDYPGWEATLNERPVEMIRAYAGLLAVPIPAGDHVLELRFNPLTYRVGAILSAVSWGALILVMAGWWVIKRRTINAGK